MKYWLWNSETYILVMGGSDKKGDKVEGWDVCK